MIVKEKGWSAIFFAVEKGDIQISKLLFQSGANLDLVGKVHIHENCTIYASIICTQDKRSVLSVAQTYSPTTYEVLLKAKDTISKKVRLLQRFVCICVKSLCLPRCLHTTHTMKNILE